MLGLALVVVAIALPDSINPSLILTDIYLAAGRNAVRRTTVFAISVFVVTAAGGILIALGVAELVSSRIPEIGGQVKYWLFVVGGLSLVVGASAVWIKRRQLTARRRLTSAESRAGQSAVVLGAGIAAIELLTAFPYFAAIGIIVGSTVSDPEKAILLGLYNVAYVLPLIAIAVTCAVLGDAAAEALGRLRDRAMNRWPFVVAPLAATLGVALVVIGILHLTSG